MNTSENKSGQIFINGRAQVVELLQYLTHAEKVKLLGNIALRNPQLAEELNQESFSFKDIERMSDSDLCRIAHVVPAPILGVAIKGMEVEFQKRVLSLFPRNYAEKAYEILVTNFSGEKERIMQARSKVINALINSKRKVI